MLILLLLDTISTVPFNLSNATAVSLTTMNCWVAIDQMQEIAGQSSPKLNVMQVQ